LSVPSVVWFLISNEASIPVLTFFFFQFGMEPLVESRDRFCEFLKVSVPSHFYKEFRADLILSVSPVSSQLHTTINK
jgi:hypothetical protein